MKKLGALLAAALITAAFAGPSSAKPVKAFTDAAGDAGTTNTGALPGLDQAGFDLLEGSIDKVKSNLEFTVKHAAMPPTGTMPEGARFLWHFSVDGHEYRFTVKSADIGKPDPASGPNGQERVGQVYLNGLFRLEDFAEGTTLPVLTMPVYNVVAYLDGVWDPATASFKVILPLKTVKAKKGSVIAGGTGGASDTSCQICWVPQYAERSLTPHTVIDFTTQTAVYKVK
ncbi:MAG: hypothetical protein ACLGIB_03120 [Actinomycetota bacterium]